MEQDFGADRARVSAIYSLALVMLTLMVLVSPRLYRRCGAPALLTVSFVGSVLGVGVCVLASTLWEITLGYGLLFGASNGLGYGLSLAMSAAAMPRRKGMVMSVVTASYAIGAAAVAPALGAFTDTHLSSGGFLALFTFLAMSGVVAVGLSALGQAQVSAGSTTGDTASFGRRTLTLWVAYGAAVFSGLMAIGHASGIAKAQGATTTQFATATMLIALGNALGGLGCAGLADRWPVRRLLTWFPVCSIAGLLALRFLDGVGAAMIGLAIVGFGYGATIAAYPPAIARVVGLSAYPSVYGRVFTAWGTAGLVAPWLAGWIYDSTGGYGLSLEVAIAMAVCSVVTVLWAGSALRPVASPA